MGILKQRRQRLRGRALAHCRERINDFFKVPCDSRISKRHQSLDAVAARLLDRANDAVGQGDVLAGIGRKHVDQHLGRARPINLTEGEDNGALNGPILVVESAEESIVSLLIAFCAVQRKRVGRKPAKRWF